MRLLLAALLACGLWLPLEAHAQEADKPTAGNAKPTPRTRAEQRRARREARKEKRAKENAAAEKSEAQESADKPTSEREAKEAQSPPPPIEDGSEIRKEGDTEVKVMEFSGLDIEGQLKTPQLLYFLNRLRAEFGRPRLPHRSFMPELERSAGERPLR
jgi:uncharacterized membrane protein